jgi:hypothetical protein
VRISVVDWRTDLNHVFVNHSRADAPANATYSSAVANA